MGLTLVKPSIDLIPSYLEALAEGVFIGMQLGFGDMPVEEIRANPEKYVQTVTNKAPFSYNLNGKTYWIRDHELLWITDGERFLGTVALRYEGDAELLEEFAGHIGMAIRPALLNRGYGPRAVMQAFEGIVSSFSSRGFKVIYATCDKGNDASARLIEHFGGQLAAEYDDLYGMGPSKRYKLTDQK